MESINKNMEQHFDWDKFTAIVCGLFGGLIHFINIYFLQVPFWVTLTKVAITAVVSGFMGLVGKALFTGIKKWWKERKERKKQKGR